MRAANRLRLCSSFGDSWAAQNFREAQMVFLPPPTEKEREDEEKPGPGEPPKIWGKVQPN
jgi:hypothetical protein